jgi:hypothetical protein
MSPEDTREFEERLLPDDERDLIAAFQEQYGADVTQAFVSVEKAQAMIKAYRNRHNILSRPN